MRSNRLVSLVVWATLVPSAASEALAQNGAIAIPFEQFTLPNGLHVVLSVSKTTPQATVDVWYHVGSKNELTGRTGFAHMFEHVMFTGSGHVPYGLHDRLTEGVGGNNNGSTTNDRTNYFENVPSNYVESALWLESDRMGFLLDSLDQAKFEAQRDIVQNERRQGIDNQPYGRAFEILATALLPETHPYSWPVVGYMADLQKATVEDVKQFFRVYYAPSNATLVIVGDFDPALVKQWVTRYFGDLPRGAAITRPTASVSPMATEKRIVFEDRVQVPRVYFAWNAVGEDDTDTEALDLLARILSGPRTTRLTKALVYDQQSAASVSAFNDTNELYGTFVIFLTPRPGHSLAELEASTDSIISRLKQEGPTPDEMTRVVTATEFRFVASLESNLGKAEILSSGSVFHGDPGYYQKQYARLKSLTAADATVKSITRDDVVAFHRTMFQPGRAVITVTGDVDPAAVEAAVEKALAAWPAGGARPTWQYPPPPAPRTTTIYLVDKPKSAQSVFAIGLPGPPRDTPDYYAIQVMNNLLGDLFQSRLNHNIREVKGYSYGVGSQFSFGRGPGAFRAGGGIVTAKTDSALIEFMKEFRGVQGEVPFTDDEITQGKESLIQSLPARFSSVNGIGASVASIFTEDLPVTYYQDYPARINAVTREDLVRVAQRYVDLQHLSIVIVGDRQVVEAPLAATRIVVKLDLEGKPLPIP